MKKQIPFEQRKMVRFNLVYMEKECRKLKSINHDSDFEREHYNILIFERSSIKSSFFS